MVERMCSINTRAANYKTYIQAAYLSEFEYIHSK